MSATSTLPTVRILAFSPPVVNGQNCALHLNFGTSHKVLEGSLDLMRAIGTALMRAGREVKSDAPPRGKIRKQASGRRPDPVRLAKLLEILAIAQGDPKHGEISAACHAREIKPEIFHAWRTQYLARQKEQA